MTSMLLTTRMVLSRLTSYRWLDMWVRQNANNLKNSFGFKPYVISRATAGEEHLFYIGSPTGKSWNDRGYDAPWGEMEFVRDYLIRPGAVAIECGAHHGSGSILLSRWVGDGGKVVVLEPMPENVAIIKRNVELNRLQNVILVEKAVGANAGHVSMKNRSNGSVRTKQNRNTIQVESVTLDDLVKELDLSPTFLKIDVEGFEYQVLEGSRSVLAKRPAILLEVHLLSLTRYGNRFEDLWGFIDPADYEIFVEDPVDFRPISYQPGDPHPDPIFHLWFRPRAWEAH